MLGTAPNFVAAEEILCLDPEEFTLDAALVFRPPLKLDSE